MTVYGIMFGKLYLFSNRIVFGILVLVSVSGASYMVRRRGIVVSPDESEHIFILP